MQSLYVSVQCRIFTRYPRRGEQICMSDHIRTHHLPRLCGASHINAFWMVCQETHRLKRHSDDGLRWQHQRQRAGAVDHECAVATVTRSVHRSHEASNCRRCQQRANRAWRFGAAGVIHIGRVATNSDSLDLAQIGTEVFNYCRSPEW